MALNKFSYGKKIIKIILFIVSLFVIGLLLSDNLKIDVMHDNYYPVMLKFDEFKAFFLITTTLSYMTIIGFIGGIWRSFNETSFVKFYGNSENEKDRFGFFLLNYVISLMLFLLTGDFILSYFFTF